MKRKFLILEKNEQEKKMFCQKFFSGVFLSFSLIESDEKWCLAFLQHDISSKHASSEASNDCKYLTSVSRSKRLLLLLLLFLLYLAQVFDALHLRNPLVSTRCV